MAASTKRACQSAPWPDIPWDLLGDVLSRLPTLGDRVRLRAVCRPWRAGARLQPCTPGLPWPWLTLPDGTVLDVANDTTHRLRLPTDAAGPCYSAGENMFFHHCKDEGQCSAVNGFSGAATPFPELAALLRSHMVHPYDEKKSNLLADIGYGLACNVHSLPESMVIKKVAMSSANHHRLMIVAVLASKRSKSRVFISTCRPAGEANSCFAMPETGTIFDIAFFQGKVYAHLAMSDELVAIDLITSSNGCSLADTPPATAPPGAVEPPDVNPCTYTTWIRPSHQQLKHLNFPGFHTSRNIERYLVESNGKLLMVWRYFDPFTLTRKGRLIVRFKVFEAVLGGDGDDRRWEKVDHLDGRALFVGAPCSGSLVASSSNGDRGARGDCIYFSLDFGKNPIMYSGVYSMEHNVTIMPLMPASASRNYVELPWDSLRFPAWFFLVEV